MLCTILLLLVDVVIQVYVYIYKASQPRGRASGSRAYGRHEMQGVIYNSYTSSPGIYGIYKPEGPEL